MYDGQYLFKSATVFSPWFARGGDNVRVTAELIDSSSANLEIELYHKNSEDTGNGTAVDATKLTISSAGRAEEEWEGLKELVRYRIHSTGTAASDYILFRTLAPVWFDAVKA